MVRRHMFCWINAGAISSMAGVNGEVKLNLLKYVLMHY